MNWVRSKARKLSLLALFALAVQLGLSFGHIHTGTFAHSGTIAALSNPASPGTDHDQDNGNDVCAICATIAMANTLVDAVAPVLPLPVRLHAKPLLVADALQIAEPKRLFFQSRAPPRS